jgi:hypothetical protein
MVMSVVGLLALGCEENLDPATPEGALHRLRNAAMTRDAQALLAASSTTTHETLAQLQSKLQEQKTAISEKYRASDKEAARAAFPKGILEATDSGALFTALMAPQLATFDTSPGHKWGLTAMGSPTITEGRASVPTQSGETIEFVLEDNRWKTTVFERPLEQNLNRVRLNEQTLTENLKVFGELKRRDEAEKAKAAP